MEDLQSASKLLLKALKMRQRYMRMSRQKFPNLVDGYIRGSKGAEASFKFSHASNKATIEGEFFLLFLLCISAKLQAGKKAGDIIGKNLIFHATSWTTLYTKWSIPKVVLKASNGPSSRSLRKEESKSWSFFQMLVLVQLASLPLLSKLILRPLEQVNSRSDTNTRS